MNAHLHNSWNSEADLQDGRVPVRRLETRAEPIDRTGPGAPPHGRRAGSRRKEPTRRAAWTSDGVGLNDPIQLLT